ncbi:MAG: D-alanyl-D-alanine carboxypeptidase/D-alanyl-D-alanine-endopeptidase [Bacteroidaceae bacterium]|nr:D-alanyl-D-alanine carboxypeptidase/D-alanyl-D-alanine-endopeptidase [Bacteroidaceae bacterium]
MKNNLIAILLSLLTLSVMAQETDYYLVDDSREIPDSLKEFIPLLWPETLQMQLDDIVNNSAVLKSSQYGLEIFDLTTETMLYCKNATRPFLPASTMKVFTSTAALANLGKDHLFVTKIGYTGTPTDNEWLLPRWKDVAVTDSLGTHTERVADEPQRITSRTLRGNICVKGAMDPMFSDSDVKRFAAAVKALNVDTIYGSLALDLSLKDTVMMGEGWAWDDVNPVLSPLLVDKKDVFSSRFLKYLKGYGVVLTGPVIKAEYAPNAVELAECTHPLKDILTRTMKNSDNTYAECVFYKVGSETSSTKGVSAKTAKNAINRLIQRVGRNPEDYYIADGSGLSRYSHLSPEVEVDILRYAYRRSHIFNTLYEKMPVAGIDGTLSGRMKGTKAYDNVRAKTGTLSGVSTLAGYCKAPNGHWLAFCIMNNGLKNSAQGKEFQNKVCTAMCTVE